MNKNFNIKIDPRRKWIMITIFGLKLAIARWIGNCFSPAIVLVYNGFQKKQSNGNRPAMAVLTFRFNCAETTIYFNGFRFWWNSEHLARRFGECSEQPFGDVYTWRGHEYF